MTGPVAKQPGMEEVLALESAIRAALPGLTGKLAIDARQIMKGFPATGTRLAALREVVGRVLPNG